MEKSKILVGHTKNMKFYIVDTTEVVKKMCKKSNIPDFFAMPMSYLMGQLYIMQESDIKSLGATISIKAKADGLFGDVYLRTTGKNKIYANMNLSSSKYKKYEEIVGKNDFNEFQNFFNIGTGLLEFTVYDAKKINYSSMVEIQNGRVDEAIKNYYEKSVQIDSFIQSSVSYDEFSSGAIVIEKLPGADDEIFEKVKDKFNRIYDIAILLKNNMSLDSIVKLIFEDDNKLYENDNFGDYYLDYYTIDYVHEIDYKCNCTKKALIKLAGQVLGKQEAQKLIEETGKLEITCDLCNKKYSESDINKIF